MKSLTKENIKQHIIDFSNIFGIDLIEEINKTESKSQPIGEYIFKKDVFGAYKLAEENKLIESVITLNEEIISYTENMRLDNLNSKEAIKLSNDFLKISKTLEYCEYYIEKNSNDFQEYYKDYWLFENNNIKKELNPRFFPRLSRALDEGLFKLYDYQVLNNVKVPEDLSFSLNKNLYIVDSLNTYLQYIKTQNTDNIQVTYILKVEDIEDYSYFCLVIQYKGNVWIGTDKLMFANPNNKYHSRNPYRSRETYYDKLDLPYGLIDQLSEIRKQTKVPVKNANLELHVKKIEDFPLNVKVVMHQLALYMINDLYNNKSLEKISTYNEVVLSLPEGESVKDNQDFSSDDFSGVEQRVNEIKDIAFKYFKEIDVYDKRLVLNSEYYDPDWLATPESLQNLNNWIANNKLKNDIQKIIDDLYPSDFRESDKLHKQFANELIPYLDNIYKYIFSSEDVSFRFINYNISQFTGYRDNKDHIDLNICHHNKNNNRLSYGDIIIRDTHIEKYLKEKFNNISNSERLYRKRCLVCNEHSEKKSIIIDIKLREQLQELFGLNYKDIPEWLKLYKSHQFQPYHGNSILDNVDPLASVNDRLSEKRPNGLTIVIKMCGYCYRRLLKKYKIADKSLITFDLKTNKIVSLEPNEKKDVTNNDDFRII